MVSTFDFSRQGVTNNGRTEWGPPRFPEPPVRVGAQFTEDMALGWTPETVLHSGGIVIGGSPFVVEPLPARVQDFARNVYAAGRSGVTPRNEDEQNAAEYLLDKGFIDPLPTRVEPVDDVEVVVPVYGDAEPLERCLESLSTEGLSVIVVDDATFGPASSRIAEVVDTYGARLIRHDVNLGPGGARNTGFSQTTAPFVAFIDADAIAHPEWVRRLRPLFEDPLVGAVGPRVRPAVAGASAVELYEETRSELDMGAIPSRVVHGVAVGWLPSASVVVRRSAVTEPPFEPGLRVGEDVDLFWRMDEAGWTVRYVPDVISHHEVRVSMRDFIGRRAMYGSSAAHLEKRHPRRLTPASPSLSGIAVLLPSSTGHPRVALGVAGYELARQRKILGDRAPWHVVGQVTMRSLWSDGFWLGHLLRRDWWPVGWLVLAATPNSRIARGVAAAMMWEPVRDHVFRPTRLDPVRSLAMRLLDDASYGTGVIKNAIRERVANVITPRPRIPWWPRTG